MRHVLPLIFLLCLNPTHSVAQETENQFPETLEEFADGMRNLLEGFADDLAPMMEELSGRLEGLRGYHAPEMLPNGDIIIRRKPKPEVPPEAEKAPPEGAIDI